MKIELNCADCGSNRFIYPFKFRDDSMIVCADCAHEIGSVAALKQQVVDQIASQSAGDLPSQGEPHRS